MRLSSFDISGPFAHFRKIYGTNTAMTYSFPPRTTICGLLAAILGLPKDSWHERTGPDKIRIGVANLGRQRRTYHRVNNLMVKNVLDLRGRKDHVQTPLELLTGDNPRLDNVHFRIYLSPGSDETFYREINGRLGDAEYTYAPSLGAAFCPAFIRNYREYTPAEISTLPAGDSIRLTTATNHGWIYRYDFSGGTTLKIDDDTYPLYYEADGRRGLGASIRQVGSTNGNPLPVILNQEAYSIKRTDNEQIGAITFLEHA